MEKNFYYLLFNILMMFSGIVSSQSGWVRQYTPSQVQSISLLSVSFVTVNTGFIVGGSGTVLHTTNGGTVWISQLSRTMNWLRGVSATDVNTATAVGDSGIILHTTNGGEVWDHQLSGTTNTLNAVSFTDLNNGTAVGGSGIILHTTNGGKVWERQSSGTSNTLNAVFFTDVNVGTAVGDSGTILRTTNGGIKWTTRSISKDYGLGAVSFPSADTGIVVGIYQHYPCITPCYDNGPRILRTINGGVSWINETPNRDSIASLCKQCYPDPLFGVSFIDAKTGTVVLYNQVYHTSNGGVKLYADSLKDGDGYWILQLVACNNFHGICFSNDYAGTAVGENGMIYHTTNGGITGIKYNPIQLPKRFVLDQNFPNPFNPSTTINYSIPEDGKVVVKVFDVLGRELATLVNDVISAGAHSVLWNASNYASGIYFYSVTFKNQTLYKKMLLIK